MTAAKTDLPLFASVKPPTDCDRVLEVLRAYKGGWVPWPYRTLPGVMWHSRVSDLRKKGHVIEMRRVSVDGERKAQFQYRLV